MSWLSSLHLENHFGAAGKASLASSLVLMAQLSVASLDGPSLDLRTVAFPLVAALLVDSELCPAYSRFKFEHYGFKFAGWPA